MRKVEDFRLSVPVSYNSPDVSVKGFSRFKDYPCLVLKYIGCGVVGGCNGDGGVFNVATGESVTIRELAETIVDITGTGVGIVHEDERVGDVRDSRADVGKIAGWWRSEIELAEGLK